MDDDAVDAVEQRGRRGPSRPDVPARRGRRRAALVGERRLEGARGTRRSGGARGAGLRAGRPGLRRTVRRAPRRGRRRHRVIPWDEVSDAEGTGIVHIAPGCGQEDFALSQGVRPAVIDPIDQFGVFGEGFGWQTGRYAGATEDPADGPGARRGRDLERKGLLVAKETYAHSYPHCWRCGTQLIFRLVDEWFIAMDAAARADQRLDARHDLAAAGDRPRGARARLAAEHGRLDDQQEALLRAGAADLGVRGLRRLGGHRLEGGAARSARSPAGTSSRATRRIGRGSTPSRSPALSCGGRARRTPDVGNPWLDAGIVGLSTLRLEHRPRRTGQQWYPADWISESFPGQFRNWFYALLTMSTVMTGRAPMRGAVRLRPPPRRARRGDAQEQGQLDRVRGGRRPHRRRRHALDVRGRQPGHEPPLRLRPRPTRSCAASSCRCGTRTASSSPTPGWTAGRPDQADGVEGARTLLDRWILSRLDALVAEVRGAFDGYDAQRATRAIEAFVDDLSNWYVRRNRRRFWKGELDADKRAAYATLYEVLTTLAALMAPITPHLADAMWDNLVASGRHAARPTACT